VAIEEAITRLIPAISKVLVVGDKHPYLVALITLQQDMDAPGQLTGLALDVSPSCTTVAEAMDDPAWQRYITSAIERVNADGTVCRNNCYKVQKYMIFDGDFTLAGDDLTPALKYKRFAIQHKYARQVNDMYAASTKESGSVFQNWPVAYVHWRDHGAKI